MRRRRSGPLGWARTSVRLCARALLCISALLVFGRAAEASSPHDEGTETPSHADAADGHTPRFEDVNWFEGLVGESDTAEPGLLFRAPGTEPPVLATLLNSAILFGLLFCFGRRPIAEALRKRRESIMHAMLEAARMKEESQGRLETYEKQLATMEEQAEHMRLDMKETERAERERALAEAQERRERLEREAHRLVTQEMDEARTELRRRAVRRAMMQAAHLLTESVNEEDHRRLADAYLQAVGRDEARPKPTGAEP